MYDNTILYLENDPLCKIMCTTSKYLLRILKKKDILRNIYLLCRVNSIHQHTDPLERLLKRKDMHKA